MAGIFTEPDDEMTMERLKPLPPEDFYQNHAKSQLQTIERILGAHGDKAIAALTKFEIDLIISFKVSPPNHFNDWEVNTIGNIFQKFLDLELV